MAGWLHGVFVGDRLFVFPLCGFSLSLFCNYQHRCDRTCEQVEKLVGLPLDPQTKWYVLHNYL